MLDPRYVMENLDEVRAQLSRRGFSDSDALDRVAELSTKRRKAIAELETLRAERNEVSKAMGKVADKKSTEFAEKRDAMRVVGERVKGLDARLKELESELDGHLLSLPNLPDESTPEGVDERSNVELRVVGDKPVLDFDALDHADIGPALGILDFERGARLGGTRFTVLRGLGARLERALINFMLDLHATEHGYEEIWPPVLVKDSCLRGTGQLPKFAEDVFRIAKNEDWEKHNEASSYDLYLSPTAEVQVTNLHAGEILDGAELPIAYTAYSANFRSEAGNYGKDTRGLIRQHQFDKVELVRFVRPEDAEAQHELLTGHAEEVLKRLGLHYRVVQLCGGDMGFAATKAYDLEVWLPGQNRFLEISSCSWFSDFQARRAKIRYRPAAKDKPRFVHTINGSGLAAGRTLVAILEQYQQADGSVVVPEALRGYMGGVERITKR